MSISTRSGASSRHAWSASRPSAASPTTSRSGCASRIMRRPARTSAWSSAIEDADHSPPPSSGRRARTAKPPPGSRAGLQLAAVELDALAHADEPVAVRARRPGGRRRRRRTSSASEAGVVAHRHRGRDAAGVLEHVRQRLLDHAVRRSVDARSQRRPARRRRAARRAARPRARGSPARRAAPGSAAARAGCPPRRCAGGRAAGSSSSSTDRPASCTACAAWRACSGDGVDHLLGGSGLEHHDADAVGDGVVQLAGHPGRARRRPPGGPARRPRAARARSACAAARRCAGAGRRRVRRARATPPSTE